MLLAVEGGGFFSASASGYSKGLALLLLGQKNEDKPMKVTPWNQYQLVDQESDSDLQLASAKNRISRGCASFLCFGRASAGLDAPSPLKVGPVQQQDSLPESVVSEIGKDGSTIHYDDNNAIKVALKSSLKRPSNYVAAPVENADELAALGGNHGDIAGHTKKRNVQWTDLSGSELVQIREFEPSETGGSDDEYDGGNERSCSCAIM